jgi:hypothetical protein
MWLELAALATIFYIALEVRVGKAETSDMEHSSGTVQALPRTASSLSTSEFRRNP